MRDVVNRYGEVAKTVKQREFKRFTEEIRQKWNPLPEPAEDEFEPGHRAEGWTDEGAFAMCVFQEARDTFGTDIQPSRREPLCEAERRNQVYFGSMETLFHEIFPNGPLYDPRPEDGISEALTVFKADLQRQADETAPSEPVTVEVPQDLAELMRVTDGVSGAGIPSETAWTFLVGPLRGLRAKSGDSNSMGGFWSANITSHGHWKPFATFQLGCCTQHRQIDYVFCRDAHDDAAPVAWKVFDWDNSEGLNLYDSLAAFLEHETVHIEATPGGHKQEHILMWDRYPTYHGWPEQDNYECSLVPLQRPPWISNGFVSGKGVRACPCGFRQSCR